MMLRFLIIFPLLLSLAGCAQPVKRVAPASHSYTAEQLKAVSDDALCRDIALYPTTEPIRMEKERRKLDCTATTMAMVQSGQAGYLANNQSSNTGPSFWQGLGQSMVMMNAAMNQQQATQRSTCNAVSIPPIATAGCKSVCINGTWAEVC